MHLLKSLLPWLLPIGIALYLLGVFLQRRTRRSRGFKDLVKNPRLWEEMAGRQEQIDEVVEASRNWSDEQIAEVLENYLFKAKTKKDAWPVFKALSELGTKVHPPVLNILRDEKRRYALMTPTGEDLGPEAPFNRACDLLGDTPPEDSVNAVRPFLNSDSDEIRKDAALVIGKAGTADIVQPIRQAFADKDEYVRSYALMGLRFATKENRLHEQCRRELFGDVCRLTHDDENGRDAAETLTGMDKERAKEYFLSSPSLTAANPRFVYSGLRAMVRGEISIPREQLLSLIHNLEKAEDQFAVGAALGEALHLLGRCGMKEDTSSLEGRLMQSEMKPKSASLNVDSREARSLARAEARVVRGAASGLLALYQIEGFEQRVFEARKEKGVTSLTPTQRLWYAVFNFDAEICNGGLSQYFLNSSGENWKEALAGLEAMKTAERAEILREAVTKFGTGGPALDTKKRREQLAALGRKDDKLFEDLNERYFACSPVLEAFTTRYVIDHAQDFR